MTTVGTYLAVRVDYVHKLVSGSPTWLSLKLPGGDDTTELRYVIIEAVSPTLLFP